MNFYLSDGQTIEVATPGPDRPLSSEQEAALLGADARTGRVCDSRPDVCRNLRRKDLVTADRQLTSLGSQVARALQKKRRLAAAACGN